MESYITFFDRKISDIDNATLEAKFNIKIEDISIKSSLPAIPTSICSCQQNDEDSIENFKLVENVDQTQICVICREKYKSDDTVVTSFDCHHDYHFACIQKWLKQSDRCIMCYQKWKFLNDEKLVCTVHFEGKMITCATNTSESDVCQIFNVPIKKFGLYKNGTHVSTCTKGSYGICTRLHHDADKLELKICNTIQSKIEDINIKSSVKVHKLKNTIAQIFSMLPDNILLIWNDIELHSDFDKITLANVGIESNSVITVVHAKPTYKVHTIQPNFVVIYSDSQSSPDPDNLVKFHVAGRSSWYPSAYVKISDGDMSEFLSSLYILMKKVCQNEKLTQRVIDNYQSYLKLYQMPDVSVGSLESLLQLDAVSNVDRTIISASFYELLSKMKSSDTKMSGINVLFNLLLSENNPQIINWTYAKKLIGIQKTFQICSPLALNKSAAPVLTVDDKLMIVVYTGTTKDIATPVVLFQPIFQTETKVNPAIMIKDIPADKLDFDDREIDECIMICIDTSNSMSGVSDFDEDIAAKEKSLKKRNKRHGKVWNKFKFSDLKHKVADGDVRKLKNVVIWFITNPLFPTWKKKTNMNILRQIVILENYVNPEFAECMSVYRPIFFDLFQGGTVKIGSVTYSSSFDIKSKVYDNVPEEYICPISMEIFTDPVVAEDGFSYERSHINKWLATSDVSPMTGMKISKMVIPNHTLRSTVMSWKDKQDIIKMSESSAGSESLKIIRQNTDSWNYSYETDDVIYDLMYYLYKNFRLNAAQYVLKNDSGYLIRNKLKKLSKFDAIYLELVSKPLIEITVTHGINSNNKEKVSVPENFTAKDLIYSCDKISEYDKVQVWNELKFSGDRMWTGTVLDLESTVSEDVTLIAGFPTIDKKQENYLSRLDVVKKLFDAFIDRSIAYGFNTAIGLMQFNDSHSVICPITSAYENFRDSLEDLVANGGTKMYGCIDHAAKILTDWKQINPEKKSKTKLRIICLSDGCDTDDRSYSDKFEIKSMLRSKQITLDCIFIGNDYDNELISISCLTGGYIYNPPSITDGYNLMELETLIISTNRDSMWFNKPLPVNKIPPMLQYKKSPVLSNVSAIQKELNQIMKEPHPDIDVYVGDNIASWEIIFSGPESTPYNGGCWLARMIFSESYPDVAPTIRMITPIKHCNVNAYGRICHSILDRNYIPGVSIKTILECVYGLLLNPDVTDPLDTNLALSFYEGSGIYEASVMDYVKIHATKTRQQWKVELPSYLHNSQYT